MEKPKLVFRSARLSSGREESIAEHSWRMALMAAIIAPKLEQDIDIDKTLKIILVHDIGEIEGGDIPSHIHAFDQSAKDAKDQMEEKAMLSIRENFPEFGSEIFDLWREYESQETFESRFIKALDKIDARVQMIDDSETANFSADKKEKSGKLALITSELCSIDKVLIELDKLSKKEREEKYGF